MPLSNFTNLDFDQVKESLKDYLRSNSNFTDYDFEGSNLSTIIDTLAYNTYITSYNANMVANEVFLDSATLRENVVSIARNIGYLPRSRKAARATVSFYVDASTMNPKPVSLTLRKGPVATSVSGFAGQSFIFSTCNDITVPVTNGIAVFNNIPIYEGPLITQNFTYRSKDKFQKFILPNDGIDVDLLNVFVRQNIDSSAATRYTRQDNLFSADKYSKTYFLQEIADERYELLFGDGVFGQKLEDGNYITVDYVRSNGANANGVNEFSFNGRITYVRNSVEYDVLTGISLLTTGIAASGGEAIETVESIRKFAPRVYSTQNRAVTSGDYETLIPAKIFPETESIAVFGGEDLVPPQYGKVFVSIKPKNGDFLPNLIKQNIKQQLKKYAIAGIVTEIIDLKYLYIETESNVYYNTNLTQSAQEVSTAIQTNVNKYAESTELNKYGARFKYSKFQKIIDDSDRAVTSNITTISMRRDLRVVLNAFAEYAIGFGNEIHIKNSSGFNIKSSGFRVEGVNDTLYVSDIPNFDGTTGSLFLFTVPSVTSQTPTIFRRNVGTINYINGIITLNPIKITAGKLIDGQPIIEISATPKSNDIIGLQDLYLQYDMNNSNFNMVVDSISSGLDSSASSYITTSSYANGNLVRSGGRAGSSRLNTALENAGVGRNSVYYTGSSSVNNTESGASATAPSTGYSSGGAATSSSTSSSTSSTSSGSSGGSTSSGSSGGSTSSGGGTSSGSSGGGYGGGY